LAAIHVRKSAAHLFAASAALAAASGWLGGCTTRPANQAPMLVEVPLPDIPPLAAGVHSAPLTVPASRPRKTRRAAQETADIRNPRKKLTIIDPGQLIGLEPGAVQKLLGAPAQVRNDEFAREWVYAASGCSFRVFFYPNIKTASFRALKYGSDDGNGELIDTSDLCIRHILTARNDAAE
jgi:hypothetical protein